MKKVLILLTLCGALLSAAALLADKPGECIITPSGDFVCFPPGPA